MVIDERTAELCRLVRLIVSSIADDRAAVTVEPVVVTGRPVFISVRAADSDRGKLIGRDGRVAEAIRQYVRAFEAQHGGDYDFEICGDTNPHRVAETSE